MKRRRNTISVGRLFVTTCRQPGGAPLVDDGCTTEAQPPFRSGRSRSFRTPFRWSSVGDGRWAITVGWWKP